MRIPRICFGLVLALVLSSSFSSRLRGDIKTAERTVSRMLSEVKTLEGSLQRLERAALRESGKSNSVSSCCSKELERLAKGSKSLEKSFDSLSRELSGLAALRLDTRGLDQDLDDLLKAAADLKSASTAASLGRQSRLVLERIDRIRRRLARLQDQLRLALYRRLIEPTNECTLLVRKTCGEQDECHDSSACRLAKDLLEDYNRAAGSAKEEAALDCQMALEDAIVFPSCAP